MDNAKLKDLISKRGSIKGRITRFKNSLDVLVTLETISELEVSKLSMKLSKVEALFVDFDDVQNQIEIFNSENQVTELATRDLIEQDFFHCIALAQDLIKKNTKDQHDADASASRTASTCHHKDQCNMLGFKLPVIKIPNFDGTYFKWLEFKETFESLVHKNDRIESIHKFHYLNSYLEGEAARVISNLEVSHKNYTEAWELLCERYDNKRQLINNHLKSLFSIENVQESDKSLRFIIDHVTKNLRALSSLGLPTDKWDVLIIYIVAGKLHSSTYFKWEEHRNDLSDIPTLKEFFDFLKSRADVLETVHRHKQDRQDKPKQFNSFQHKPNTTKALLVSSGEDKSSTFNGFECFFCKQAHRLYECPTFKTRSVEDRKHLPVGYHGRSSSIVISGTPITRPFGQTLPVEGADPHFGPCRLMDFELEVACFVGGPPTQLGERVTARHAEEHIFGFVLMNDWSARDIQKWEYVPLGPFTAKNLGTSISPWVVTVEALTPYIVDNYPQEPPPFDYLRHANNFNFDIKLEVDITTSKSPVPSTVCRSNYRFLYWTVKQQLAQQTITGCNLRPGDLLGSGTISGDTSDSFGSMLELSWKGTKPLRLKNGEERKFLADGDTVILRGYCVNESGRIGFGTCEGKLLPAVPFEDK